MTEPKMISFIYLGASPTGIGSGTLARAAAQMR